MKPPQNSPSKAFSLVEVTLALGVAGFCLTTLFGLLPVGLNSNQSAVEQTAAAGIADTVLSDLRVTPISNNPASPRFGFTLPTPGTTASLTPQTLFLKEDGSPSLGKKVGDSPVISEARYRVTVGFIPPTGSANTPQKTATMARIVISWPALADKDPTSWPKHALGSFESFTALDRN